MSDSDTSAKSDPRPFDQWNRLPEELRLEVLSHLDYFELKKVGSVSKTFQEYIKVRSSVLLDGASRADGLPAPSSPARASPNHAAPSPSRSVLTGFSSANRLAQKSSPSAAESSFIPFLKKSTSSDLTPSMLTTAGRASTTPSNTRRWKSTLRLRHATA